MLESQGTLLVKVDEFEKSVDTEIVFYRVNAQSNGWEWISHRRYSDFYAFQGLLRQFIGSFETPFPGKLYIQSLLGLNDATLERRRRELEMWLKGVVNQTFSPDCPVEAKLALIEFLKAAPVEDRDIQERTAQPEPRMMPAPLRPHPLSLTVDAALSRERESSHEEQSKFPTGLLPFVIDNGSRTLKLGAATASSNACPAVVMSSVIGRERKGSTYVGTDADARRRFVVGNEAESMAALLDLQWPVRAGVIKDFDALDALYRAAFEKLQIDPAGTALLVTAPLNPRFNRQRLAEMLFDEFQVGALSLTRPEPLELFAAGRTTGCIVSCGHSVTTVLPCFEGQAIHKAAMSSPVAGDEITLALQSLLGYRGHMEGDTGFTTTKTLEHVKENWCYVSKTKLVSGQEHGLGKMAEIFSLPDGQELTLASERVHAPEVIFNPQGDGKDGRERIGVGQLAVNAIEASEPGDWDVKRNFLKSIVLGGGTTELANFDRRLRNDVVDLTAEPLKDNVDVVAPEMNRDWSAWVGGAVVADFAQISPVGWMLRSEYEDHGPSGIVRFCYN